VLLVVVGDEGEEGREVMDVMVMEG